MEWPEEQQASSLSTTVFVRNLPYEWGNEDLSSYFESIGPVKRCFIVTTKKTRESRGFGFVEFAVKSDAEKAVKEVDGQIITSNKYDNNNNNSTKQQRGRRIRVEMASKKGSRGHPVSVSRAKKVKLEEEAENQDQTDEDERIKDEEEIKGSIRNVPVETSLSSDDKTRKSKRKRDRVKEEVDADADAAASKHFKPEEDSDSSAISPSSVVSLSSSSSTSSSSPSCILLISNIPPQCHDLTATLLEHSLHPSLVIFPSPESTNRYKAARLTFKTFNESVHAHEILSKVILSPYVTALRCIYLHEKAARLIVRNLPFHINEKQIRDLFSSYGPIISLSLPLTRPDLSRGFAFIQYQQLSQAVKAIQEINGKKHWGRILAVDWSLDKQDYLIRTQSKNHKQEEEEKEGSNKESHDKHSSREDETADVDNKEEESEDDSSFRLEDSDEDVESLSSSDMGSESESDASDDLSPQDEKMADNDEKTIDSNAEMSPSVSHSDVDDGCTLFIRNLSYETTEDSLYTKFSSFGPLRYAKIVREKKDQKEKVKQQDKKSTHKARDSDSNDDDDDDDDTAGGSIIQEQRSKGMGFVRYVRPEDAQRVLALCRTDEQPASHNGDSSHNRSRASLRSSLVSSLSSSSLMLDGRVLNVVLAVSKDIAAGYHQAAEQKKDKRNLYLAREGVILSSSSSAASASLSVAELQLRERYWAQKKKKLENPNFFVSKVRLSVRNLPIEMTDKELKTIFRKAAKEAIKEEIKREKEVKQKELLTSVIIKQAKIARDQNRMTAAGLARSKRYGFVEFVLHSHALIALRYLNNNPSAWNQLVTDDEKTEAAVRISLHNRPIVEFAIEDVRKIKEKQERQKRAEKYKEMKDKQTPGQELQQGRSPAAIDRNPADNRGAADVSVSSLKEAKRAARILGVCYKCGQEGHLAKKCKGNKLNQTAHNDINIAGTETTTATSDNSINNSMNDTSLSMTDSISTSVSKKKKKKKAKQPSLFDSSDDVDVDILVENYKKKFFGDATTSANQRNLTGKRWFQV